MVAGSSSRSSSRLVDSLVHVDDVTLDSLVAGTSTHDFLTLGVALARQRRTHSADSTLLLVENSVLRVQFCGEHLDFSRVIECILARVLRVSEFLDERGLLTLVLHAVHELLEGTRHRLDARLLVLSHLQVRRVVVGVLVCGFENLVVVIVLVTLGRELSHESILVAGTAGVAKSVWVDAEGRLVLGVHLNLGGLVVGGSEVLDVLDFAVAVAGDFGGGERAHARLENVPSLLAPPRTLL